MKRSDKIESTIFTIVKFSKSCFNDFYRMLIKEQINKFLTNEKIEISMDGDTHYLTVSLGVTHLCG